ncbi:hypothetical protein Pmani_034078 [Petrolisthes manimaculis]|uniref:PLAT domain-containing protein n=1 Tax=Petrolisthes manimaculis TaxID=1843537 RepID=A0AAE1TS22_9EUCA|nr:hypothetical protein Pmani_034078 [Petrolisthes manimaculis]
MYVVAWSGATRDEQSELLQIDVLFLSQLTSTGLHNSVLVLYMDLLSTQHQYMLYLTTHNMRTNYTGLAQQKIEFSPAPSLGICSVLRLKDREGPWFRGSCLEVEGHYYPVLLQWSYHFLWMGVKTVFYHGSRTSIDFSLPSGLESNDYKIYLSVRAIDGKGVSYKYPSDLQVLVGPQSQSGDDVLNIFWEISTLQIESPPLLLQHVRSLTWELNLITSSDVTQTVLDNILAIVFYGTSCKDSFETVTSDPLSNEYHSSDFLLEVNLLKSCARDHLAEIVAENPVRDEMEVLQVLTALQIIIDAKENISSTTYLRVMSAMHEAVTRMWFCYNNELKTEATREYFVLASAMLDKQTEIYDWNSTSVKLSQTIISHLMAVMELETSGRFLEEEPLTWYTNTLTYHGYWAEAENINRWEGSVPFVIQPINVLHGVYLVQSLIHKQSPYRLSPDPITSDVVNLAVHIPHFTLPLTVKMRLQHSLLHAGEDYDFRREGELIPGLLSVYELHVKPMYQPLAFHVLLQITNLPHFGSAAAAVILICESLQNLQQPLYQQEIMATQVPSQALLYVSPYNLTLGKKYLVIMDKNSYENNWARHNRTGDTQGAEFKVSAWWSSCLVWNDMEWDPHLCSVVSTESSWDYTTCSCQSQHTVYGAQTLPVLEEESKMAVNELMLCETFMALYFLVGVGITYMVLALLLHTSERHRLRRRNIWLRDNRPEHDWAYLLTIKTGTQWNAGTTSKVYAILHGTHGMSETRELQSKQTGQLFTRGALCTFILTTPEPLGDILKVQVWHDNSGGDASGWFVCEVSVADLVLGACYVYPCYRWLSVQADDAKVEREITLESPTTFLQDFEHFLPQYASEHMLWTSLLTTSSTAKLYRLQRLTICLIVCLCLGTISLNIVQNTNTEHTMMAPDMHIEPLYYGIIIAAALLPVQWLLEMIFKMSNRLEEKEYNDKAVLETLRATQTTQAKSEYKSTEESEEVVQEFSNGQNIYDPNAQIWHNLTRWAQTAELKGDMTSFLHPSLRLDGEWLEGMKVTQRTTTLGPGVEAPDITSCDDGFGVGHLECLDAELGQRNPSAGVHPDHHHHHHTEEGNGKCTSQHIHSANRAWKPLSSILRFVRGVRGRRDRIVQEDAQKEEEEEEEEVEEEEDERDELNVSSSLTFILSQCVGWIVCCLFVALCCMVLFIQGSGMPKDYAALWVHIIYVTLCCSFFIMQPLVVVIYTLYKVCVYRWLGCRGCISSCVSVPLDQVVAIWTRYQAALTTRHTYTHNHTTTDFSTTEKLLEERQRVRELRFARPPSEDQLLNSRAKEMQRSKVHRLLTSTVAHLLFLLLLAIIASNAHIGERFILNLATYSMLENGSCLDGDRYLDPCSISEGYTNSCNQVIDEDYMKFSDIQTKNDWWKWAQSELLSLTYNEDQMYTEFNIFCDSNSIIIGMPRLRKYDSSSQECEASRIKIDSNQSLADLLDIEVCYPNYIDNVAHVFGFGWDIDREYEWDAHFLAVTYGKYGKYSFTNYIQHLGSSRFSTMVTFFMLQSNGWLNNNTTRAVVTDFTLYHPESNLYTTISLLAEFPDLSGAEVTTSVVSTRIEKYKGNMAMICMMAEVLFLAVSMYYFRRSIVYIYKCRFRVWRSMWGLLDIIMTLLAWIYVVSLMLRVQIAEDAMWQLRVGYFRHFVNLKGLITWDYFLESLVGMMLAVHTLRFLSLASFYPRLRRLGQVVASAAKDIFVISIVMVLLVLAMMLLGHIWFSSNLQEFHTVLETITTVFKITFAHMPFLANVEYQSSSGNIPFLSYLYFLITYIFIYQLTRALFMSALINSHKTSVEKPGVEVCWKDIKGYMKDSAQSVTMKLKREKEEEESQPVDNTPPGFYMAELEIQISQVMGRLDGLVETLGSVVERMDNIEDDNMSLFNPEERSTPLWPSKDQNENSAWEENEETKSISSTELSKPLHQNHEMKNNIHIIGNTKPICQRKTASEIGEGETNRNFAENYLNLDAFTDIESCQTEIEALTRLMLPTSTELRAKDDGGRLEKFLKDVSAASDENVTSFGKYGKTQLKVNPKVMPSHESLAVTYGHNNSGVMEQAVFHSLRHQQVSEGEQVLSTATKGVSARLCRTQTLGRGKGHVDFLDIANLDLDSEDESV